jgi:beta-lactamase family protein
MLFDFLISMETQLTWYGHAAFKIKTATGKILLIDPWITNPAFADGKDELASLDRVDLIFLTHGHGDHVGNTVEIGKHTGASLVSNFDLNAAIVSVLGYPEGQAGNETTGHLGGQLSLLDGEVNVQFVPAWHGSSIEKVNAPPVYAGNPTGLIITLHDGPTIYHTRRYRFVLRHGACETISQDRRHAGLYRRPLYNGTSSGRRSGKASGSENRNSDALRNVPCADGHTQSIRTRTEEAQGQRAAARDAGWRDDRAR